MSETAKVNSTLTPAAEKFIRRLLRFGAGPEAGLKLKVAPGGCSGLAVEFDLAAEPEPKDAVWKHAGLRIFLDRQTLLSLEGATLDFTESLSNSGLIVLTQSASAPTCAPASTLVPADSLVRR